MWLKQPVKTILSRLRNLAPLGFKVPEIDPELCGDLIVSQADLIALSDDLDGAEPWITGKVSDFHITCASQRLNESKEQTLERLKVYVDLLKLEL